MKKLKYSKLLEQKEKLEEKLIPILEQFSRSSGLIITGIETVPDIQEVYDDSFSEPTISGFKIKYNVKIKTGV